MVDRHGKWSRASGALALAFVLAGIGCAQPRGDAAPEGPAAASDVSTIVLALTSVPSDVACVRAVVTGPVTVTRTFDVTPGGAATLPLGGLPVGNLSVYADTYAAACAGVGANTPATWVAAAPVAVTLAPGQLVSLTIVLRRPGGAQLTGDFQDLPLALSASSADFGSVAVGSSSGVITFTAANMSASTLALSGSTLTGLNAGDFVLDAMSTCVAGLSLAPGMTCTARVRFAPAASGPRTAILTVASMGASVSAALGGQGISAPVPTLTPASAAFGNVVAGTSGSALTFTVANPAAAPTTLTGVSVAGMNASDFALVMLGCSPGTALPPGATCTVTVAFAPPSSALGARSAILQVSTTTGNLAAMLSGTATAPGALSLSPSSADFGSVAVGSSSGVLSVAAQNTGTSVLALLAPALTGANAADFAFDPMTTCTAGLSLLPGAQCMVRLRFAPSASGARTANLVVSAPGVTATAALIGTGFSAMAPTLTPASGSFGNVVAGTSGSALTFTVANPAAAPTTLTGVSVAGMNASDFALVMLGCSPGTALPPGATCTVTVAFAPPSSALGARSAILQVSTTTGNLAAMLSGTATAPGALSLSPSSADFGSVAVGSSSGVLSVAAQNTGTSVLALSAPALTGANAADFAFDPMTTCTAGLSLLPGAQCMVRLRFAPIASGARTANLVVGAPGVTATAALIGTGLAVTAPSLSPSTGAFPSTVAGTFGSTLTFTLANAGLAPTAIMSITLTGANASDFVRPGGDTCAAGGSLAPGATCIVRVQFAPAASSVGARAATLQVVTSTGNASAALTGTATSAAPIASLVVNDNLPAGCVAPNCNRDKWSVQANFQLTSTPFGDRTFSLASAESGLLFGKAWIRTAADSKSFDSSPLATFITGGTAVYLLVDNRHNVGGRPPWLTDPMFVDAGFDVVVRQTATATFPYSVWRKTVMPGSTVALPKIGAAFASAGPGYFVVVE